MKIAAGPLSEQQVDYSPIVQALQGWRELRSVTLADGGVSQAAWKSLDAHKTLQELTVDGSFTKASDFNKLKCLQHLSVLRLNRCEDLADLLPALSGNRELESLYISEASTLPSGKAFASLRTCKKLGLIELSACRVSDEQLDAIADNLQLFSLRLIRCEGVSPRKVLALAGKHRKVLITVRILRKT
ncbi:MAG: hypothetical protein HC888_14075 [Candidatus Competibacteraceae bacterium]|nr:hypothetical protein [Candidatus Competibacteraceae bacterium]